MSRNATVFKNLKEARLASFKLPLAPFLKGGHKNVSDAGEAGREDITGSSARETT